MKGIGKDKMISALGNPPILPTLDLFFIGWIGFVSSITSLARIVVVQPIKSIRPYPGYRQTSFSMDSLHVFFLLLMGSVSAIPHFDLWKSEIAQSLERNLKEGCKWHFEQGLAMPKSNYSNTLLVHTTYPARDELLAFQRLRPTLTKSNDRIAANAVAKDYHNWAKNTESRWEIPKDHIGQSRALCYNLTLQVSNGSTLDYIYQPYKEVERVFYLLRNRHAVVHPSGSVGFECGYYMGYEGCETMWDQAQLWWSGCQQALKSHNVQLKDLWYKPADYAHIPKHDAKYAKMQQFKAFDQLRNCSIRWDILNQKELNGSYIYAPKYYKRVFVISAVWDYNYHHFIADSLARMIKNIHFLRANPDIYIHIRVVEEYEIRSDEFKFSASKMRNSLFTLLGIHPSRIIWGIVFAEEIYIPRGMHCSYTLSNPIEIRLLAKELLYGSRKQIGVSGNSISSTSTVSSSSRRKRNLIVQQRYTGYGSTDREWQNETFEAVVQEFGKRWPDHNVVRVSSLGSSAPDYCLACEIVEFSHADIFIGAHGAGLTNMMFMPPGGLIVEILGDFKDVNMPLCGYYGPLSAVVGHDHFLYSYNHEKGERLETQDGMDAKQSEKYTNRAHEAAELSYAFYLQLKEKRKQLTGTTK